MNPTTCIDFYKSGHIYQYPKGTEFVYSNFTPRSDRLAKMSSMWDGKIVAAGAQGFCQQTLIDEWNREFFNQPVNVVIDKYRRRMDNALGAGAVGTEHIEALHKLGYLPVKVFAVKEGYRINTKVPMLTIVNTLKEFFWIVNYLETVLSCELWGVSTSATIAYEYRKVLSHWADTTGAPQDFVPLQGHDFSMRGMNGVHAAAKSGFGHLLSFIGTDTVPAIDYAEDFYGADSDSELIGCSVPATEHSVMCMGGLDNEKETFRRLFTEIYPTGIVSIVSDTWDYWKVITEYLPEFKDEIMARQPNALGLNKVVIRPDSGDPVNIICGTGTVTQYDPTKVSFAEACDAEAGKAKILEDSYFEYAGKYYRATEKFYSGSYETYNDIVEVSAYEVAPVKGSIQCMWETFGGTVTEKGFKVLDEHIGLIYGDSITLKRAEEILRRLADKGFASCNVVFGIGSYTYQYNTRDTFGFAMKATCGIVNGEVREIFKDPATDKGTKKSAKGWLKVEKDGDEFVLYDQQEWGSDQGELKLIFEDGQMIYTTSLSEIRDRLWA